MSWLQSIILRISYTKYEELQLLSKKKKDVSVILFTENGHGRKGYLTSAEVSDFNSEYPSLMIKPNGECHDRFIILDYGLSSEKVYHCGASSKDAGKKVCAWQSLQRSAMPYSLPEPSSK